MSDILYPQPYHVGSAQPFQPFMPLEGMGGGPFAQVGASMGMTALGNPFGTTLGFSQSGNMQLNLQNQMFHTANLMATQHATMLQRDVVLDAMRSSAKLRNVKWSTHDEVEAARVAQGITEQFGPMLATGSPYLMDAFSGGRSPMVLAHYTHLGNRHRYDPTTGYVGSSAQSAARMSNELFNHFYGDTYDERGRMTSSGVDSWRRRANGMNSYEMGQLYQEMTARGQMGRGDMSGLDLATPEGKEGAFTRELEAVKRSLEGRTKMVKAMQEIFGDSGRPNAPIRELLDSLETLTTGVQKWTPERVEISVRQFHNAARGANISLQAAGALFENNLTQLRQMGPNMDAFAMPITTLQMNMMSSLGDIGAGAATGWGRMNTSQMAAYAAQRTGRAAGSNYANFLGALTRMAEQYGTTDTAEGRRIANIIAEAKEGRLSDETLKLMSGAAADRYSLVAGGIQGIDSTNSAYREVEGMRQQNLATVHANNYQRVVMERGQRSQFINNILGAERGAGFNATLANARELGITDVKMVRELSRTIAETYVDKFTEAEGADWNSESARKKMVAALRAKLGETEEGRKLLARPDIDKKLEIMAQQQLGSADSDAVNSGKVVGSISNIRSTVSKEALEMSERRRQFNMSTSITQSMLTGRQESDPLRRAFNEFYRAGQFKREGHDDVTWKSIVGASLGVDVRGEAAQALAETMSHIESQDEALAKEAGALAKEKMEIDKLDPKSAEYKSRMKAYEQRKATLGSKADALNAEYNKAVTLVETNEQLKKQFFEKYVGENAGEPGSNGGGPMDGVNTITITIEHLEIDGVDMGSKTASSKGSAKPGRRGEGEVK